MLIWQLKQAIFLDVRPRQKRSASRVLQGLGSGRNLKVVVGLL